MKLRMNWVRAICIGALAIGIVVMPLSASAQVKKKTSAKKHKMVHAKMVHKRTARHVKKVKVVKAHVEPPIPVVVEKEVPAARIVPVGPVAGTPYDEATWRGFHADWNGKYTFKDGKYYYDEEGKYLAQIPNEFSSIASRFGGVATLENDPTLVFTGDSGEPYPILEYNADRYKSEKKLKLKSAYFGRAYFWRDGARYDRKMIVDAKGVRCFQFVKHVY